LLLFCAKHGGTHAGGGLQLGVSPRTILLKDVGPADQTNTPRENSNECCHGKREMPVSKIQRPFEEKSPRKW
jgi:hypothetical protein